ncbi:DUF3800 domain-containing protein [Nocardioidaceae bacterium SCSIO 66511]|nr:DUF3800 domain-containing protein [Nocardioidaceae bacterium SCSIO 66511]
MHSIEYETAPIEIACDESGWSGENLLDGNTDVFAHASVRLKPEHAAWIVDEARRRIRSPATEYKANHLLRTKHRRVLEWFLSEDGPLSGSGSVYLVDKRYLVVRKLIELVTGGSDGEVPDSAATDLYRRGERTLGHDRWTRLLTDAQEQIRDVRHPPGPADPVLDPLPTAVVRSAQRWSGNRQVLIVHDRQSTLKGARLAHVVEDSGSGVIADIRFAAASSDPRIQVADFLAGTARAISSNELKGNGDSTLTDLVAPYVDPASLWADERSASRLFR